MTKNYRVLLRSASAVKCVEPFSLAFEDYDGRKGHALCDNWQDETVGDTPAHKGLLIQVEMEAANVFAALEGATNVSEAILTSLTVQSLGSTGVSEAEVAYESTIGIFEREFWQTFEPDVHGRPVKLAKTEVAMRLLESLEKVSKKSRRDRIIRAGLSLRRGLDTSDHLSRFGEYWMGLECLNPILQERLTTEPASWSCECGKTYKKEEARGVKAFLTRLYDAKTLRDILKLRRDVFHGLEAFPSVQDRAKGLSAVLEASLQRGVLFCLGASLDEVANLQITPLHGYSQPRLRLLGRLFGEDPNKLGLPGSHPHFALSSEVVRTWKDGDVTHEEMKHTLTPRVQCGAHADTLEFVTPTGWTVNPRAASERAPGGEWKEVEVSVEQPQEEWTEKG